MSKDDPEITKRKQAREVKKAEGHALANTMADRLTNRARSQTVDVEISDPDGNLIIPMRIPTWGITCELTQIEKLMVDKTGRAKLSDMMTDLSVDPSMDKAFWKGETIGLVDMKLLIEGLTSAALKRMKEVKQFRREQ